MQLRIPFLPFRLRIELERRPYVLYRPRFTMRRVMLAIAIVAIVLGGYVTFIRVPAQRRRFRNMDRAITLHIDLLRRAAAQELEHAKSDEKRSAECKERSINEEREATRWPEGSEEQSRALQVAGLWARAAHEAMNSAKSAASRAKEHQSEADALAALRTRAGGGIVTLEQMAPAAEAFLATPSHDEGLPQELRPALVSARVEHRAKSTGRETFPTIIGKRDSAIEATAIWQVEQFLNKTEPRLKLKMCKVEAAQLTPAQPFSWDVKFTDPSTGLSYPVQTFFSESTVYDYLAKNP